mmetsp:Transcript_92519/g.220202  ORF Transcript_92519/g.220202 Transcript_92519/m.220202 type:complete len:251 (-) Transcript_92519:111-863(-)
MLRGSAATSLFLALLPVLRSLCLCLAHLLHTSQRITNCGSNELAPQSKPKCLTSRQSDANAASASVLPVCSPQPRIFDGVIDRVLNRCVHGQQQTRQKAFVESFQAILLVHAKSCGPVASSLRLRLHPGRMVLQGQRGELHDCSCRGGNKHVGTVRYSANKASPKSHEGLVKVVVHEVEDELVQASARPAGCPRGQQCLETFLLPRVVQCPERVAHGLMLLLIEALIRTCFSCKGLHLRLGDLQWVERRR